LITILTIAHAVKKIPVFNVLLIGYCCSFKWLLNDYSTGPTVVKSVDIETIRQERIFPSNTNSVTTVNRPVIIDEWKKPDNIVSSSLI